MMMMMQLTCDKMGLVVLVLLWIYLWIAKDGNAHELYSLNIVASLATSVNLKALLVAKRALEMMNSSQMAGRVDQLFDAT